MKIFKNLLKKFKFVRDAREFCSISKISVLKNEQFKYLKTKHSWHLVDPSPWPLVASLGAFFMTSGGVMYMHNFSGGGRLLFTGFLTILYVMYTWWRDIVCLLYTSDAADE